VKVGEKTKLIRNYTATPTSTNDGVLLPVLITAADRDAKLNAAAAYTGAPIVEHFHSTGTRNYIQEKRAEQAENGVFTFAGRSESHPWLIPCG